MAHYRLLASAVCCALLCSCAEQRYKPVDEVELPQFVDAQQAATAEDLCAPLAFGEATELLQQVSRQNLQLQAAAARVRRAQAQAQQNAAARWPSLQIDAEATRGKMPPFGAQQPIASPAAGDTPVTSGDSAIIYNQYQASLAASYELDLWSRVDNLTEAAHLQVQAQQSDARAMAVSLSAQLLEAWFDLAFALQQQDLLKHQQQTGEQLLDLLKLRFVKGQSSAVDAVQQRQQTEALTATLAQNRAQLQLARHRIAVLVGEQPDAPALAQLTPQLPPEMELTSIDISASLLARRPDLQTAFYQMQAADAQHAAAVAERLPSVQLTASLFDQSRDLGAVGENLLWRIAAAITQPLFSGGRISAQIDAAQARLDEALAGYRQALLTALQELADAWTSEQQAQVRLTHLHRQHELAEQAYQMVRSQYRRGAVNFMRVLDAQQSLTEVEQELLRSRRQRLSYRVQFCRALGNHWLQEQPTPEEDA